ncbi:hypothetical protein [Pectobacterium versatile]|uniref:hypothetical protein n=1 Tax=Pectobacterium versatile TaxID=2488639 RepID=UPI001CCF7B7B|nr:hypothetical protein [Pectobacterium versatile]
MTYEEAMERLTAMGRTSIADLATFGTHVVGEDDDGKPISQSVWSFKNASELKPEQMAAISELTAGKDGLKIKLHDPTAGRNARLGGTEENRIDGNGQIRKRQHDA